MSAIERSHLAILQEIQRGGSLTAAAERLCLTQPALTHSMKKLEQQLGVVLWIREGRGLKLTQAGSYLLELAERLLPQFEKAEEAMAQFAAGRRGILRIGMECHPCTRWFQKVVGPFLAAWPDVELDVKQEFRFGGIEALAGHDIDLLITPDPVETKELSFTPVFDYELMLAVPKGHPLAGEEFVTPAQLRGEVLITYPVPVERLDIFTRFLIPAGVRPKVHKTVETTDIMLQMVAAGRGVTALPHWLVGEYATEQDLRAVQIGPEGIGKQIFIGTREVDFGIDYIQGFITDAKAV
jgi:LysR family transcriptional regulator, regulator for metE and metH